MSDSVLCSKVDDPSANLILISSVNVQTPKGIDDASAGHLMVVDWIVDALSHPLADDHGMYDSPSKDLESTKEIDDNMERSHFQN